MKVIEAKPQELQALAELIDAGVKYLGLPCVKNAAHWLTKLESAEDAVDPISNTAGSDPAES